LRLLRKRGGPSGRPTEGRSRSGRRGTTRTSIGSATAIAALLAAVVMAFSMATVTAANAGTAQIDVAATSINLPSGLRLASTSSTVTIFVTNVGGVTVTADPAYVTWTATVNGVPVADPITPTSVATKPLKPAATVGFSYTWSYGMHVHAWDAIVLSACYHHPGDVVAANDCTSYTYGVGQTIDLATSLAISNVPAGIGSSMRYTITVSNLGTADVALDPEQIVTSMVINGVTDTTGQVTVNSPLGRVLIGAGKSVIYTLTWKSPITVPEGAAQTITARVDVPTDVDVSNDVATSSLEMDLATFVELPSGIPMEKDSGIIRVWVKNETNEAIVTDPTKVKITATVNGVPVSYPITPVNKKKKLLSPNVPTEGFCSWSSPTAPTPCKFDFNWGYGQHLHAGDDIYITACYSHDWDIDTSNDCYTLHYGEGKTIDLSTSTAVTKLPTNTGVSLRYTISVTNNGTLPVAIDPAQVVTSLTTAGAPDTTGTLVLNYYTTRQSIAPGVTRKYSMTWSSPETLAKGTVQTVTARVDVPGDVNPSNNVSTASYTR
jgi:hypothetical protein